MRALKSKLKLSGRGAASRVELPSDIVETLQRARSQAIAHMQKMDESDPAVWASREANSADDLVCRLDECTVIGIGPGHRCCGQTDREGGEAPAD